MELCLNIFYLIFGSACLYFGADFLVAGGVAIARKAGVSPLVIGLTLVAFATSAPELVVSASAALDGKSSIALGNVVGSNIFNIGIILGLSALINPIIVKKQSLKFDGPIMILSAVLLAVFYLPDHNIERWQGAVLFAGILFYTIWNVVASRKENSENTESSEAANEKIMNIYKAIALTILGFIGLIAGAKAFLAGAVFMAKLCNMPDAIIGLTIVAAGTSLPELATSIVAAIKREDDIALGNVIGSNIFNIFCILGITAIISPLKNADLSILDFEVMIVISILLMIMMFTRRKISRIEGLILIAIFTSYLSYLIATM